jgi:hypothetical protein
MLVIKLLRVQCPGKLRPAESAGATSFTSKALISSLVRFPSKFPLELYNEVHFDDAFRAKLTPFPPSNSLECGSDYPLLLHWASVRHNVMQSQILRPTAVSAKLQPEYPIRHLLEE